MSQSHHEGAYDNHSAHRQVQLPAGPPRYPFDKSQFSAQGSCVEVAFIGSRGVCVRDSKHEDSPILTFKANEWNAFLDAVRAGQFNIPA